MDETSGPSTEQHHDHCAVSVALEIRTRLRVLSGVHFGAYLLRRETVHQFDGFSRQSRVFWWTLRLADVDLLEQDEPRHKKLHPSSPCLSLELTTGTSNS